MSASKAAQDFGQRSPFSDDTSLHCCAAWQRN